MLSPTLQQVPIQISCLNAGFAEIMQNHLGQVTALSCH